jgi:hypothetical protein
MTVQASNMSAKHQRSHFGIVAQVRATADRPHCQAPENPVQSDLVSLGHTAAIPAAAAHEDAAPISLMRVGRGSLSG